MNPDQIRSHKAFDTRWYYRLELAPGLYTPGQDRPPVAQTRELLRRVDVESGGTDGGGARCLDVGIQEGLVTILLERRGAAEVVGYDRTFRKGRLALTRRALGARFEMVGGMKLQDLPAALAEAGHGPFDVVIFSGVLYHMFDPLSGLAVVRGLVRNGGICIVETTVAFDDSDVMYFNRAGRFTAGAYWFVTPRCLDYLLRLLRFEPLDVVYQEIDHDDGDAPEQGRIAVACRAVAEPVAEPGDEYIARAKDINLAEFMDLEAIASDAPEVRYDGSRPNLVTGEAGSVDLQASIEATEPLAAKPEQARLTLEAKY